MDLTKSTGRLFAIPASRSRIFKEAFGWLAAKWNLTHFPEASRPEQHVFEHNHPVSALGETMVVGLATKMTAAVLLSCDLKAGVIQW
jgi:hypothetical protein